MKNNLSARVIKKALFEKNKTESKNMKKKYKSTDKNLREIFREEAKPELCPECGGKILRFAISCGLRPCHFHYICLKCPREIVFERDKIIINEKLSKDELIKKLGRKGLEK